MGVIKTSLSPDNVPDWGLWEGVREFLQNALDEGGMVAEYNSEVQELSIVNNGSMLPKSFFATGVSGKRGDNSKRGKFGEGSGAALCCLARLGYDVKICSGTDIYTPYIQYDDQYDCNLIHIKHEDTQHLDGVLVTIGNVTKDDYKEIKSKCLYLQEDYNHYDTTIGGILTDSWHKGKIFCGGLYVTGFPDMENGFDIKPEYLSLDRDRQMVRQFDISWATKKMWAEVSEGEDNTINDYIADQVVANKPDTMYLHYESSISRTVKERCYQKIKETYGDDVILSESAQEQSELTKSGFKNVVFTGNDALTSLVKGSEGYKNVNFDVKPKKATEVLEDFFNKWEDYMPDAMKSDYTEMVEWMK